MTSLFRQLQKDWVIRHKLRLRQRPTGEWEVFTIIHGSQTFRWFIISKEKVSWYREHFPEIQIVPFTGD